MDYCRLSKFSRLTLTAFHLFWLSASPSKFCPQLLTKIKVRLNVILHIAALLFSFGALLNQMKLTRKNSAFNYVLCSFFKSFVMKIELGLIGR